jgi:predicted Ser/Thr protein kinase
MAELNISFGRFTLKSLLGKGGFGEVYLAYDPKLSRDVALKVLHQGLMADLSFINKARKEASLVQQIQHPNVVKIIELGEDDGRAYIEMEFIDGKPLSEFIKSSRRFNIAQVVSFIEQISSALDATHAQNIVHRDVKPANILIDKSGLVHLVDFGLANAAKSSLGSSSTVAGIGTAMYMSPEQAMGRTGDRTTDVYSLGIVAFELLTGRLPFEAENLPGYISAHLNQKPPDPKKINPAITLPMRDVLYKVLSKSPAGRYKSAGEFARALKASSEKPEAKRFGLRGCLAVALVTLAVLGIAAGIFFMGPFKDQAQELFEGALPSGILATDIPNRMPTRTPQAAANTPVPPTATQAVLPTQTPQDTPIVIVPVTQAPVPLNPTYTSIPEVAPTNTVMVAPTATLSNDALPVLEQTGIKVEMINGGKTGVNVRLVNGMGEAIKGHYAAIYTQKQDLAGNWVIDKQITYGQTDNSGQIFFEASPGNYIIGADFNGSNWGNAADVEGQANIQVDAGQTTQLTVSLGRLTVGLLRGDGSVVKGQYVGIYWQKQDLVGNWVTNKQITYAQTDNSGLISFDLTPGYYIVGCDLMGYNWGTANDIRGTASVPVQPGAEQRMIISLGQMQVGLKDLNGSPVSGKYTSIFYQKKDVSGNLVLGDQITYAQTDNTGTVTFNLTPGKYAVKIDDRVLFDVEVTGGKITFTDGVKWQIK